MGCNNSAPKGTIEEQKQEDESKKRNEAVEKDLNNDAKKDKEIKKLLLLGAGGSGKSTFFKQLQTIHGKGFNKGDRRQFKYQMHEQIVESIRLMIQRLDDWVEEKEEDNAKELYTISPNNRSQADFILSKRNDVELTPQIVSQIKDLWKDPAIQRAYDKRNVLCLPESTGIFLNRIDEITKDNYNVTDEDLLLIRYRTTGMAEKTFYIDEHIFTICDVGGQRNERRKWIHFFDNVTAVLFVAALSCYDEAIFEDETANAMDEAIVVFHEHCNSKYFLNTAFILFLNKSDLFAKKIKEIPLSVCWKDRKQKDDYDSGVAFIKKKFLEQNESDDREIYTHVTCATDRGQVQKVFDDVQHIVIQFSLERSGLL